MIKTENTTKNFIEIIEFDVSNILTQLDVSELEAVTGAPQIENDPPLPP
jgi:hypothetical protein